MNTEPLGTAWLPTFDFEERHALSGIDAEVPDILDAIAAFDDRADPVLNRLLQVREWPARWIAARWPGGGLGPQRPRFGLRDFTLLTRSDSEIAYGLVGRFWRLDYGLSPCDGAADFQRLALEGACRLLLAFRVTPQGANGCRLETVTRVACNGRAAHRRFWPYWMAIRPFSGWIRRRLLQQLKRDAQQRAGARRAL